MSVPYDTIGRLVVSLGVGAVIALFLGGVGLVAYVAWYRALTALSNWLWRGYSVTENEIPPKNRFQVSAALICLRDLRPHRIPKAIRTARRVADMEDPSREDMRQHAEALYK